MAAELKHTVMPSGGDFTTLDAAIDHIAASHADLVSADLYASIEIDGTWSSEDTALVTVPATIITDATRYLRVYTTAAARFDPHGPWDTGAYILHLAGSKCIYNNYTANLYLDGLQLQATGVNGTGDSPFINTGGVAVLSNCIVRGDPAEDTYAQYGISSGGGTVYVYNTIIYDISTNGTALCRCISNATGAMHVYSTIGIGGNYGLRRTSGTVTAKNCYFGGSVAGDYNGTITKTTCASSDTTGDTGLQSIPVSAATFVNVTPGSEDFHLASGSALIGVGTDTSGDAAPMNFTTDIDGDSRV
jgi:hypothetical protein